MNILGFNIVNPASDGTLTGIGIFVRKYSLLLSYIAYTISGISIGLIFNTVSSFEYLTTVSRLLIPIGDIAGDTAFEIIGSLLRRSRIDICFFVALTICGLTYICRPAASLILLYRGFLLGVTVGGCANTSTTFLSQSASLLSIIIATLVTAVLITHAVISDRNAVSLSNYNTGHITFAAIRQLFSYTIYSLTGAGTLILIHTVTGLVSRL